MQENLEPKAAADIASTHPHIALGHIQRDFKLACDTDWPLGSAPYIKRPSIITRRGNHWAGFHRIDDHPVVNNINIDEFQTVITSRFQRRFGRLMIRYDPIERDIIGIFWIELRRVIRHRGINIGYRWHGVILRIDHFNGV